MSRKKIKAPRPKSAVKKEKRAVQINAWKENAAKKRKIGQLISDLVFADDCGYTAEQRAAFIAAEKEKANGESKQTDALEVGKADQRE